MTTMTNNDTQVTVGVDTHLDSHVAVALDSIGQISVLDRSGPTLRAIGL